MIVNSPFLTPIQKITPQFIVSREKDDLIRYSLTVSRNPIALEAGSAYEERGDSDELEKVEELFRFPPLSLETLSFYMLLLGLIVS